MNKKLGVLAAASAIAFLPDASALAITGQLVMDGTVNLNSTSIGSATEVASFGGDVYAGGASDGVFEDAGLDAALVSINGFSLNTSPFSTVDPLWTVTSGSETFSFALTGLQILTQNDTFLDILGTGYIYSETIGSQYSQTPGTFSLSISDSDGVGDGIGQFRFGFQATTSATVPDGGATAGLLGIGALSLLAFRRRG